MTTHLYPHFLTDASEYESAEQHWLELWNSTPAHDRERFGWEQPWFPADSLKDANPIFTAISPTSQKGIRILQFEPTSDADEFDWWLDTFGGPAADPDAIRELVISCALSPTVSQRARVLMSAWIVGEIETDNTAGNGQLT